MHTYIFCSSFGFVATVIDSRREQIYKKTQRQSSKILQKQKNNLDRKVYLVDGKDAHNCEFKSLTKFVVSTFVRHRHCEELANTKEQNLN